MINLKTTHSQLIKWFQLEFPELVQTMKDCSHHYDAEHINAYHLEGDIWTHTCLVFKNSQVFSPENDYIKFSTLFHDIGKILAVETVEIPISFENLTDEEIYYKYKDLIDEFIEK